MAKIINLRSSIKPKEDSEKLLSAFVDRIVKCIQSGRDKLDVVRSAAPTQMNELREASISSNLYDWITAELERGFEDDPDVKVLRVYKSLRLLFKGGLTAKFNKVSSRGTVCRNYTATQTNFFNQQPEQLVLPHIEYATNIIIAWQEDTFRTTIERIIVQCPMKGKEIAWEFIIKNPSESEVIAQFSTIVEPTGKTSKIKPRKPRTKEREANSNND